MVVRRKLVVGRLIENFSEPAYIRLAPKLKLSIGGISAQCKLSVEISRAP